MIPALLLTACVFSNKESCPDGAVMVRGECVADSERPCFAELAFTVPEDGAVGVNAYNSLQFAFSDLDPSAVAWIDGVDTDRIWDRSSTSLILTPEEPLAPNTTYTGGVRWCHDEDERTFSFTTSALGEAADISALPGRTWTVVLSAEKLVEPDFAGELMESLMGDPTLLLAVNGAEGEVLTLLGAPATLSGEQDFCTTTPEFTASVAENPLVEIAPTDLELPLENGALTLLDAQASFVVAPDGSFIAGGELRGTLDTRGLDGLVDDGGQVGAVCDLLASMGISCSSCPNDGAPFCVELRYTGLGGEAALIPLTPIPGECDVLCTDADGECLASACGCASGPPERGLAAAALALALGLLRRARA